MPHHAYELSCISEIGILSPKIATRLDRNDATVGDNPAARLCRQLLALANFRHFHNKSKSL